MSAESVKNISWTWFSRHQGSKDQMVSLCHFLLNLYIFIAPCYLATAQSQYLMVIGRDGSLSTLCQSCGLACQQRALETFPGLGWLHSEDGIVWLYHFLVILHVCSSPFYLATALPSALWWLRRMVTWGLYVYIYIYI